MSAALTRESTKACSARAVLVGSSRSGTPVRSRHTSVLSLSACWPCSFSTPGSDDYYLAHIYSSDRLDCLVRRPPAQWPVNRSRVQRGSTVLRCDDLAEFRPARRWNPTGRAAYMDSRNRRRIPRGSRRPQLIARAAHITGVPLCPSRAKNGSRILRAHARNPIGALWHVHRSKFCPLVFVL